MLKTHNCGDLRLSHAGQTVVLAGWLHRRRDHGGLILLDLRDRSGLVQVTVEPGRGEAHAVAERARNEFVLKIAGQVRPRPETLVNPNLASGQIAANVDVPKPSHFKLAWYAAIALLGLRRSNVGGFGSMIPEQTSRSGFYG